MEQARREKGEQAENALAGEELASALPETSPIEEEKETAALESVSEAIDGSEEEPVSYTHLDVYKRQSQPPALDMETLSILQSL